MHPSIAAPYLLTPSSFARPTQPNRTTPMTCCPSPTSWRWPRPRCSSSRPTPRGCAYILATLSYLVAQLPSCFRCFCRVIVLHVLSASAAVMCSMSCMKTTMAPLFRPSPPFQPITGQAGGGQDHHPAAAPRLPAPALRQVRACGLPPAGCVSWLSTHALARTRIRWSVPPTNHHHPHLFICGGGRYKLEALIYGNQTEQQAQALFAMCEEVS